MATDLGVTRPPAKLSRHLSPPGWGSHSPLICPPEGLCRRRPCVALSSHGERRWLCPFSGLGAPFLPRHIPRSREISLGRGSDGELRKWKLQSSYCKHGFRVNKCPLYTTWGPIYRVHLCLISTAASNGILFGLKRIEYWYILKHWWTLRTSC